MSNDLLKQIDDLVASKTFNLDALDGIKMLKESLGKQITEVEYLRNLLKDRDQEIAALKTGNNTNGMRIEQLIKQIEQGANTVAEANRAIWEKEVANAKAAAYEDALKTVFKPATVRETIYQSIPLSQNYNGTTSVIPYQQETKTTKEEL